MNWFDLNPVSGASSSIDDFVQKNAFNVGQFMNNLTGVTASNSFNADEAEKAREFSANQARLAFQRELDADSTKYQRAMDDLKAAGINPILAVQNLSGGSVSGSQASSVSASSSGNGSTGLSALLRGISQIVSSAIRAV